MVTVFKILTVKQPIRVLYQDLQLTILHFFLAFSIIRGKVSQVED